MKDVVIGHKGKIGSVLFSALPLAVGIDLPEHDLRSFGPWASMLYGAKSVYVCAGNPNPEAGFSKHVESLAIAENAIMAALAAEVSIIYFCSSTWAEDSVDDGRIHTAQSQMYGATKRHIEAMAERIPQLKCIRVGWFDGNESPPGSAPEWMKRLHWPSSTLLNAFNVEHVRYSEAEALEAAFQRSRRS